MSLEIANLTERQLRIGVIQLGVMIAVLLVLGTLVLSLLVPRGTGLSYVPVEALLFAVGFSILVGGVRSFLSIIDWIEARKARSNG